MTPTFDFPALALILAGISFGMIGVLMAGVVLFPDCAERAKREYLPQVMIGLLLVALSGLITSFFAS